jgi:hypothetical protein
VVCLFCLDYCRLVNKAPANSQKCNAIPRSKISRGRDWLAQNADGPRFLSQILRGITGIRDIEFTSLSTGLTLLLYIQRLDLERSPSSSFLTEMCRFMQTSILYSTVRYVVHTLHGVSRSHNTTAHANHLGLCNEFKTIYTT